jgi:hypothetical protein
MPNLSLHAPSPLPGAFSSLGFLVVFGGGTELLMRIKDRMALYLTYQLDQQY